MTCVLGFVTAPAPPAAAAAPAKAAYRLVRDEVETRNFGKRRHPLNVLLPPSYDREPARRYPTLYVLHGLRAGGDVGPEYWLDPVRIPTTLAALLTGSLRPVDLVIPAPQSLLDRFNRELAAAPFEECIVVLPWTLNGIAERYVDFLAEDVVAHVDRQYRTIPVATLRGIDGGCLGGIQALFVGWRRPDVFGHVGAVQPDVKDFPRAVEALRQTPAAAAPARVQIVSTAQDRFHGLIQQLSAELRERGVRHELVVVPGGHGSRVYRGVGGIQMLLFHSAGFRAVLGPLRPPAAAQAVP